MTEYPQPDYQPGYQTTETNVTAVVSLVFGILSWLGLVGIGGIVAVIAGHIAKDQIRKSEGRQTGDGLATAGLVLGYSHIVVVVLGACLIFLILAGVITGLGIWGIQGR